MHTHSHTVLVRAWDSLPPAPSSHLTEEGTEAQGLTISQRHRQNQRPGLLGSGPGSCLAWEPLPHTRHRASVSGWLPGGQVPASTRKSDTSQGKKNTLFPSPLFLYNGGVGPDTTEAPRLECSASVGKVARGDGGVAAGIGQGVKALGNDPGHCFPSVPCPRSLRLTWAGGL